MPQDIKLWEIIDADKLKEIPRGKLSLEERLENWLENDISLISSDILIIGRQVITDFGGAIDLLGIDHNGDLVIIELKREKTPREVTAQVLDYAAWVKNLSHDRITEIANRYFKDGNLEDKFSSKFGAELPETLNKHHQMLIVASEIDDSTARIIKYLSDYGFGINAITFGYFKDEKGHEFVAQTFLIEPREGGVTRGKGPLTYKELQSIADDNNVGDLYRKLILEIERYFDQKTTTRSSLAFIGLMGENKNRNVIFSLLPPKSNAENGLHYEIYTNRFCEYSGIQKEQLLSVLPSLRETEETWAGGWGRGYFKGEEEAESFINLCKSAKG